MFFAQLAAFVDCTVSFQAKTELQIADFVFPFGGFEHGSGGFEHGNCGRVHDSGGPAHDFAVPVHGSGVFVHGFAGLSHDPGVRVHDFAGFVHAWICSCMNLAISCTDLPGSFTEAAVSFAIRSVLRRIFPTFENEARRSFQGLEVFGRRTHHSLSLILTDPG